MGATNGKSGPENLSSRPKNAIFTLLESGPIMEEQPKTVALPHGFEEIYAKYKTYFVRIALSYVRDRMAAEDIVTDSFVVFWENRRNLDKQNIPAYIYTVIIHKCRNWLRDRQQHLRAHDNLQRTELRILSDYVLRQTADDPKKLLLDEALHIIEQELLRMSPVRRRVFIAYRYEEMSYREIAAICSLSESQVDYEIRAAKKMLRVALKDYLPLAAWLVPFL